MKLRFAQTVASRDPSTASTLESVPEDDVDKAPTVDILQAEIDELQNELEEAQKDHDNTIAELDTVQAQLDDTLGDLEHANATAKTLTEELDEANKVRLARRSGGPIMR